MQHQDIAEITKIHQCSPYYVSKNKISSAHLEQPRFNAIYESFRHETTSRTSRSGCNRSDLVSCIIVHLGEALIHHSSDEGVESGIRSEGLGQDTFGCIPVDCVILEHIERNQYALGDTLGK